MLALLSDASAWASLLGLILADEMRVALLVGNAWIIGLTEPVFTIFDHTVSWRDLVLGGCGLFLLAKGTMDVHSMVEDEAEEASAGTANFTAVIAQIIVLGIVFSLDSVITAVGTAEPLPVMIAAVLIAVGVMLVAAEPTARFVNTHPTVKMLALSFLMLVGVALIADGLHLHIPREYIYFAIVFSAGVEALNRVAARAKRKRREANQKAPASG